MDAGPRTIRPNVTARLCPSGCVNGRIGTMLVTTSDGRLVGLIRRDDVEALAARP